MIAASAEPVYTLLMIAVMVGIIIGLLVRPLLNPKPEQAAEPEPGRYRALDDHITRVYSQAHADAAAGHARPPLTLTIDGVDTGRMKMLDARSFEALAGVDHDTLLRSLGW